MRETLRHLDVALLPLVAGTVFVAAVLTNLSMRYDSSELLLAGGVVCGLGVVALRWSQR